MRRAAQAKLENLAAHAAALEEQVQGFRAARLKLDELAHRAVAFPPPSEPSIPFEKPSLGYMWLWVFVGCAEVAH